MCVWKGGRCAGYKSCVYKPFISLCVAGDAAFWPLFTATQEQLVESARTAGIYKYLKPRAPVED